MRKRCPEHGRADLFAEKKRALDRLAQIGCRVVLVPAIVRGVNEHEIGDLTYAIITAQ